MAMAMSVSSAHASADGFVRIELPSTLWSHIISYLPTPDWQQLFAGVSILAFDGIATLELDTFDKAMACFRSDPRLGPLGPFPVQLSGAAALYR